MLSSIYKIESLKKKFKKTFLARQYQSLNTEEIDQLHEPILSARPQKSDNNNSLKNQFNNPNFWAALKEASGFSNEVEHLENQWHIVKRFADFNAQELMSLKRKYFDHYEVALTRALEELESDLKRYELNGIWRPKWVLELQKEKLHRLNERAEQFGNLERKLQSALGIMATMHGSLGAQKHVDDIYAYFVKSINQLNLLRQPLQYPINPSCYLDDDTRIAIHDYLGSSANVLSESELESIIAPINQTPYKVPVRPNQARQESKDIEALAGKIESFLQITSVERYKKDKQKNDEISAWLTKRIVSPLSRYISSTELFGSAMDIWRYRWLLALIASVGLYVCLAHIAIAYISLTMGAWATNIATNILFYGVALFPAYVMGVKALGVFGNMVYEKLSYWKAREIQQSLELLKLNQRFVSSQLSAGISDVALFDIKSLSKDSKTCLQNIEQMINTLEKIEGRTRFVYWGILKSSHKEVLKALKNQKQLIESRLSIYSKHISERLAESLVNFRIDISDGTLKPTIPKSQIQSLHSFVKEHGTIELQNQFQKSTNISTLFVSALLKDDALLQRTTIEYHLNQPWGGSKSNIPGFRGWETLIKHYTLDENQKEAALNIVGVLTAKRLCTLSSLGKWVSTIAPSAEQELMQSIQQHIFLSLDSMPASHARLLSGFQKNLIKVWGAQNKKAIEEAQAFVRDLNIIPKDLSGQEESSFVKHFEALEGLDRLKALQGQSGEVNNIRTALEYYNGKSTSAIYLLKFLPENIKPDFTAKVAIQRLNRIISRTPKKDGKVFRRADKLLFNFLVKRPKVNDKFNLENQIRSHAKYKEPWTAEFSHFLNQCTECGVNDGSLEADYESLNKRVKEFVQNLSEIFAPGSACKSQKEQVLHKVNINPTATQAKGVRCA